MHQQEAVPAPGTGQPAAGGEMEEAAPAPGTGQLAAGEEMEETAPAPGTGQPAAGEEMEEAAQAPGTGQPAAGKEMEEAAQAPGNGEPAAGEEMEEAVPASEAEVGGSSATTWRVSPLRCLICRKAGASLGIRPYSLKSFTYPLNFAKKLRHLATPQMRTPRPPPAQERLGAQALGVRSVTVQREATGSSEAVEAQPTSGAAQALVAGAAAAGQVMQPGSSGAIGGSAPEPPNPVRERRGAAAKGEAATRRLLEDQEEDERLAQQEGNDNRRALIPKIRRKLSKVTPPCTVFSLCCLAEHPNP
jgi:hypothetical protein